MLTTLRELAQLDSVAASSPTGLFWDWLSNNNAARELTASTTLQLMAVSC
jgi:hypothetical protein